MSESFGGWTNSAMPFYDLITKFNDRRVERRERDRETTARHAETVHKEASAQQGGFISDVASPTASRSFRVGPQPRPKPSSQYSVQFSHAQYAPQPQGPNPLRPMP